MNARYRLFYLLLFTAVLTAYAQNVDHVIQRGETIYSLARSYGVTVQDILSLNGITDPRMVQAGQHIRIPQKAGTAVPAAGTPVTGTTATGTGNVIQHQVVRSETLYGIARQYGTTVQVLRGANNLAEDYVLKAGDWLRIPRSGTAGSSAVPTAPAVPANAAGGRVAAAGKMPETAPRPTQVRAVDASIRWPVNAQEVRYMTGKLSGVVLLGEQSESVRSLTQGTVVSAGPYRGFGKVVIVQMTGGYLYVYGGCESLTVKEGDKVVSGTELGKLGIDGVSAKPQLFFLAYRNNNPIDPANAPRV